MPLQLFDISHPIQLLVFILSVYGLKFDMDSMADGLNEPIHSLIPVLHVN